MNFTDHAFFWFFAVTFFLYYLPRDARVQIFILVAASLFFYAWEYPKFLFVFLTSWFITSVASYRVLTAGGLRGARAPATVGVVSNLGLLAFFKYKFLFIGNAADLASRVPGTLGQWLILAPLPIGISFYTFHGISLLVDTYRRNTAFVDTASNGLGHHLLRTLLYLVFFPQLIAGPIIKARDFYPQICRKRFKEIDFTACCRILILGYFLKSVVADNLSQQTFWIAYPYFQWRSSIDLFAMLLGYSAQIFADFAGYSLLAIGFAMLLGYKLPQNFNFPYIAASISDFWRRWHMSLSSWLRDYLYVPLGGNQKGAFRTYVNLIVVMFLGGLWHGAAWSFAIWGLWHGVGLALERPFLGTSFMRSTRGIAVAVRILMVFTFVTLGWLLFKLQRFEEAWAYLRHMFRTQTGGTSLQLLFLVALYGSCVAGYHIAHIYRHRIPGGLKDVAYGVMLFLIVTSAGPSTPFIYFQF